MSINLHTVITIIISSSSSSSSGSTVTAYDIGSVSTSFFKNLKKNEIKKLKI
jgi:hypothetical protein